MANALIPIGTIKLTSAQTDVTLAGLPQNYRDLRIVVTGWGSAEINIGIKVNNDSGSNYSQVNMRAYGAGSVASSSGTGSSISSNYSTGLVVGNIGLNIYDIFDYSQTNKHKSMLIQANHQGEMDAIAGRWASTAAITSVTITSAFSAGSTFEVFGVSA